MAYADNIPLAIDNNATVCATHRRDDTGEYRRSDYAPATVSAALDSVA
ncbi:unnamed protein product (plasmid) [Mycetohabitans rhizoxinica HKI 454]|uniref:Uncharacterized protein n=1 Tax=Mycetohabitans rhizoxinica (strain DSM 19002 / CIP 109453 / HKI 454) TaxID=882378 RepID=E5AVP1_MYCRK|nr:unnamed protein product [Mycetohabitans rhizoxinica HKI 454]